MPFPSAWAHCVTTCPEQGSPRAGVLPQTVINAPMAQKVHSFATRRSGHIIQPRGSLPWHRLTEAATGVVKPSHITRLRGTQRVLHVDSWKTAKREVSYDLSSCARRPHHLEPEESARVRWDLSRVHTHTHKSTHAHTHVHGFPNLLASETRTFHRVRPGGGREAPISTCPHIEDPDERPGLWLLGGSGTRAGAGGRGQGHNPVQ